MESIKEEAAPLLLQPESWEVLDIPTALGIKTPLSDVKLKHSRYDEIWSEDVHAAFMEAISIYPPMGKRRLRYVRILKEEDQDQNAESSHLVKSFGRCQLIQSYILEKTGKNRTRKQVSSHLQRLKKKYKNDKTKRALFLEVSQLTQEHSDREDLASSPGGIQSPNISLSLSLSSNHPSPFDDVVRDGFEEQKPSATPANGSYFTYYHVDNRHHSSFCEREKVSNSSMVPQVVPALPMGVPTEGNSVSTGPEISLSLRRLSNKLSPLTRQSEMPNALHSSQIHCSPGCQVPHHVVTHDDSFTMMDFHRNYPLTPVDQLLHTPLQPPQITRLEKRRVVPENVDGSWNWPVNADTSGSPVDSDWYAPHAHTAEPLLSFPDMRGAPAFYMDYMSDFSPRDFFPLGLSHAQLTCPHFLHDPCAQAEEQLASPLLIKPIPIYPVAYAHAEDRTPHLSPDPAL
ncbi:TEA/ATTS domain family-domain-containing protein [Suillus paluster]|uniref:TEA/ATTS domain family-domain-containing protein n=1 Tax=Suillus paluster TaxID=48578 RepID=UPI001B883AB0|nr:TEA/ATTS domain family-domain-containing protein [Suillus paluster]KAG1756293.1 TEA/ATTS domain family-domain-containing protein [Suillus paluster]